jgi:hypothetical protein
MYSYDSSYIWYTNCYHHYFLTGKFPTQLGNNESIDAAVENMQVPNTLCLVCLSIIESVLWVSLLFKLCIILCTSGVCEVPAQEQEVQLSRPRCRQCRPGQRNHRGQSLHGSNVFYFLHLLRFSWHYDF